MEIHKSYEKHQLQQIYKTLNRSCYNNFLKVSEYLVLDKQDTDL